MTSVKDTFGDTIRISGRDMPDGGVYLFLVMEDGKESSDMALDEFQVAALRTALSKELVHAR